MNQQEDTLLEQAGMSQATSRRHFLQLAGGLSGLAFLSASIASCKKDKNEPTPAPGSVNLGSGDVGILNYAYALEQLEAAFYIRVVESAGSTYNASELALLTDIRDHEIAHREFFKAALGSNAIGGLEVNFDSINFSSRDSVLAVAKTFEDLGVSAYNGAGQLLTDPANLLLAGKIVSVEARHAAWIRDRISNGTFADMTVVDANGLDVAKSPTEVLAAVSATGYVRTQINASNLPTA